MHARVSLIWSLVYYLSMPSGFRPVIDRRLNYYIQIASTAGSTFSLALYRDIKPTVDNLIESGATGC
jgi:hypothetical protein